jgi:hypothetical protein
MAHNPHRLSLYVFVILQFKTTLETEFGFAHLQAQMEEVKNKAIYLKRLYYNI